jgi:RNA polymerase sigma-70 factor (ECF subfamily)
LDRFDQPKVPDYFFAADGNLLAAARVEHTMEDRTSLDELRRGAPGAARRLIQQYNRTLWRIARGILRDDAEAEEAVQEAYLRAFSRLGEFRGDSSLGTWLARITINEALRRLQTRRAAADLAELDEEVETDPADERMAPATPTPEQAAARAEIRRIVERAVDALPAPYRLAFVMRVLEQMSIEETAAALHIPAATVKSRLHRANQQLRETLGAEFSAALEGAFPFAGVRCEHLTQAVMARLLPGRPIEAYSSSRSTAAPHAASLRSSAS